MSSLPVLPDISFVETNPQQIIDDIISGYEQTAGYTLAEGDPRRLYLLSIAYVIIQQRQKIDASGKSNLLYYAQDDYLDHLGAMRLTPRIQAQPAVTSIRFTLSALRPTNVGIPQGTRVTADNVLYFKTTAAASVIAGQLFVDVPAEALTAGAAANGIAIGQINRLVDPIPYVQTVANTAVTSDGRDKEANDPYRERIYQAPVGFSIAGPEEAYKFFALSASSSIADVAAYTPTAGSGIVAIRPLLQNGEIPTQPVLDLVAAACSAKTVRPLTDLVQVTAPEVVNYDVELTYYIRTDDSASADEIISRVDQAVTDYVLWQKSKLGRSINPDELIKRIVAAGAKRAGLVLPVFAAIQQYQVAVADTVTVTYGGLEDD